MHRNNENNNFLCIHNCCFHEYQAQYTVKCLLNSLHRYNNFQGDETVLVVPRRWRPRHGRRVVTLSRFSISFGQQVRDMVLFDDYILIFTVLVAF